MDEIIKSALLEYEKSSFLIDLIKRGNLYYVSVKQQIKTETENSNSIEIKLNERVLTDFIEILNIYQKTIPKKNYSRSKYFSHDIKEKIKQYYFKGLEIANIAFLINCPEEIVRSVLTSSGIEIISNKLPDEMKGRASRKRKK